MRIKKYLLFITIFASLLLYLAIKSNPSFPILGEPKLSIIGAELTPKDISEEYPEGTAYTICDLNVRKTPDGDILKTLAPGTKITVSRYNDDWAYIGSGYCHGAYLTKKYIGKLSIQSTSEENARYTSYIYGLYTSLPSAWTKAVSDYDIWLCQPKEIPNTSDSVVGLTISNDKEKQIWITADSSENLDHIFYHEAAHAVDHTTLFDTGSALSDAPDFIEVYQKECNEVLPIAEYFAESFWKYTSGSKTQEKEQPLTHQYFTELLEIEE